MNVKARDAHLNELIGVKQEETTEVAVVNNSLTTTNSSVPVAIPDNSDKDNELIKSRIRMNNLGQKLNDVVNSHTDVAVEFGKARDVEAVAAIAKTLVEINREIRETNRELYDKGEQEDEKDAKVVNKTQNNIIFKGDMRELNDLISGKNKDEETKEDQD